MPQSETTADEPTHTNVESFSSDRLVERYTDRATSGLFEKEATAIDRYFTDRNGRVLDVGCGGGRTTGPLAARGFDVIGIDISPRMVRSARSTYPEPEFQVGDVTDLSFAADTFDYALIAHNGLDYVHPASERRRALRELHRVLRPGGVLVFSTHNAWYRFPALFLDSGFIRTFYLERDNHRRLFRRYKLDVIEGDPLYTYMTDPIDQRRQLRRTGFVPVELVGAYPSPLKYFEAMLHHVARAE